MGKAVINRATNADQNNARTSNGSSQTNGFPSPNPPQTHRAQQGEPNAHAANKEENTMEEGVMEEDVVSEDASETNSIALASENSAREDKRADAAPEVSTKATLVPVALASAAVLEADMSPVENLENPVAALLAAAENTATEDPQETAKNNAAAPVVAPTTLDTVSVSTDALEVSEDAVAQEEVFETVDGVETVEAVEAVEVSETMEVSEVVEVSEAHGEEESAAASSRDLSTPEAQLRNRVEAVLHSIYDPEIPVDIYELGLIYTVDISDTQEVSIQMTLTSPACPVAGSLPGEVEDKVLSVDGVEDCFVELVWDPPWNPDMMSEEARLELGFF